MPLIIVIIVLFSLSGCNQHAKMQSQAVDFTQIHWYAQRAALAYRPASEIKQRLPNTLRITTVPGTDVQYFIEDIASKKAQLIAIRGTANIKDAIEDAEYLQSKNSRLDIYVHNGFDEDAQLIYLDILPYLDKNKTVLLTGHSLGAAISTLLMMYLHEDGFTVGQSINFGQPKVTNAKGVAQYAFLPLLRIVDENDVVPLLPFISLLDSVHGSYAHIGPEVILLEGEFYVFQAPDIQRLDATDSFWDNALDVSISAHYIKHYLHNIGSKVNLAQQIPYDQRQAHMDQ